MIAQGEVGWPTGRLAGGASLAPVPDGAKPAPAPPAKPLGALATGRGEEGAGMRWAIMNSAGMRSSKTTTMRSRRRVVDRMLTE
ncbi:MAG: hypothetical protein GEV13_29510 [Rhodospirillales bacterium]|nr:hypothetical protein [Rhodospirillales bacterium]